MISLLHAGIAVAAVALASPTIGVRAAEAAIAPATREAPPASSDGPAGAAAPSPLEGETPPDARARAAAGEPPEGGAPSSAAEPPVATGPADGGWSFGGIIYAYAVPESRDYVQPTLTADRDGLHLEARFNYEDLDTGSAWVGWNLGGGGAVEWEFQPLLGGVFGSTDGIAPGYKLSLGWWRLGLYSEGEYVVDVGDTSESFFYNWSELTLAPAEWFRFGIVTQRTRAYEAERELQRGFLFGFSGDPVELTMCVFNPDDDQPVFVVGFGASF